MVGGLSVMAYTLRQRCKLPQLDDFQPASFCRSRVRCMGLWRLAIYSDRWVRPASRAQRGALSNVLKVRLVEAKQLIRIPK